MFELYKKMRSSGKLWVCVLFLAMPSYAEETAIHNDDVEALLHFDFQKNASDFLSPAEVKFLLNKYKARKLSKSGFVTLTAKKYRKKLLHKPFDSKCIAHFTDLKREKGGRELPLSLIIAQNSALGKAMQQMKYLTKEKKGSLNFDPNDALLTCLFTFAIDCIEKDHYELCASWQRQIQIMQEMPHFIFIYMIQNMDWVYKLRLAIEKKGKGSKYQKLFFERGENTSPIFKNFFYLDLRYEVYACIENNKVHRLKELINFYGLKTLKEVLILDASHLRTLDIELRVVFFDKVLAAKKNAARLGAILGRKGSAEVKALLQKEGYPPSTLDSMLSSILNTFETSQKISPKAAFEILKDIAIENALNCGELPDVNALEGFISLFICEEPYLLFRAYYKNTLQSPQEVADCFARFVNQLDSCSGVMMDKFISIVKALIEDEMLFSLQEEVNLPDGRRISFGDFLFEECFYKLSCHDQEQTFIPFYIAQLAKENAHKRVIKNNENYLVRLYERNPEHLRDLFYLWAYPRKEFFYTSEEEIQQQITTNPDAKKKWQEMAREIALDLEEIWERVLQTKIKENENDEDPTSLMENIKAIRKNYEALQALVPIAGLGHTNAKGENILMIATFSDMDIRDFKKIVDIYRNKAFKILLKSLRRIKTEEIKDKEKAKVLNNLKNELRFWGVRV